MDPVVPPIVWLPFVVAYAQPLAVDIDDSLRYVGLAIAVVSAAFAAWAMWSLGRSYGIVLFHIGASLAMESSLLLAITALFVVPYTAVRIAAEEKVLHEAFGERYLRYGERVPALIPFKV